jgi:hypothetical protein
MTTNVKGITIGLGTLGGVLVTLFILFRGMLPVPVFAEDLKEALEPIIQEQTVARGDRAQSTITQQRILISLKRTEKYDFSDRMTQGSDDKRRLEILEKELAELERALQTLLKAQLESGGA